MADLNSFLSRLFYQRLPQISGGGGSASGVLTVSTTTAGTLADTNETDLWSYTMPANTLGVDGRMLRIVAFGSWGATANTKVPRIRFGGTQVAATTSTGNGTAWRMEAIVVRTGASSQIGDSITYDAAAVGNHVSVSASIDTTAAIIIKVTGANGTAAANDIVFRGGFVELLN